MRDSSPSILACAARARQSALERDSERAAQEGRPYLSSGLFALVLVAPRLGLVLGAELTVLDDLADLDKLVDGQSAPDVCRRRVRVSVSDLSEDVKGWTSARLV